MDSGASPGGQAMTDDRSMAPAAGRAEVDAAKAEVLAARQGLVDETVRFGAAARSAVDIPARVRDDPLKVGGAAAGLAFLVAGGPQRVFRRVRRLIWGPEADLPKSMLPEEVDKTLRKLGTDGEKVRGTLEREFADYLEAKSKVRKERDLTAVATTILGNIFKPVSSQAGRRMAQSLFSPDRKSFDEALRRMGRREPPPTTESPPPPSDQPRR